MLFSRFCVPFLAIGLATAVPAFSALSSAEPLALKHHRQTGYSVYDLGEVSIAYPGFAASNNNYGEVADIAQQPAGSSPSYSSILQIWSPLSKSNFVYFIPTGDLVVLDVSDKNQVILEGDASLVLWTPDASGGASENLKAFDGSNTTYAGFISDSGVVPGGSELTPGIVTACTWTNKSPSPKAVETGLPEEYVFQIADQVNNNGDMIIWAMKKAGSSYVTDGFLFKNGKSTSVGRLPGVGGACPMGLNDSDEVVGSMFNSSTGAGVDPQADRAFIWRKGKLTDLGTLGLPYAEANSINNSSIVVGMSYSSPINSSADQPLINAKAFVWSNGKMKDLNSVIPKNSGWVLQEATQINNKNEIVGLGTLNGEAEHVFVLLPD